MTLHSAEPALHMRRRIPAPREKVFRAFTQPDIIPQWIGGGQANSPDAEVDLRVGGRYRIYINPPNSTPFYIVGVYHEVEVPEKLVYTWGFEGSEDTLDETLVTVEFVDLGEATEVILQHERFPDALTRDMHNEGWVVCLNRIEALV